MKESNGLSFSARRLFNSRIGLYFHPRTWWFHLLTLTCRSKVASGPFQGMRYVKMAVGSCLPPKILGTYEKELHAIVEAVKSESWHSIIDVGAAEGYYAIGLAREGNAPVIAFEMDRKGRELIEMMSHLNGVSDHVRIFGECTPTLLADCLVHGTSQLLIMDAEGAEEYLLADEVVEHMPMTTVLVEVHESPLRELSETLRNRFAASHRCGEFTSTVREMSDFTGPGWLAQIALRKEWVLSSMDESRGGSMHWLVFTPNDSPSFS